MKKKKYFKVARKLDGKYYSAITDGWYRIQYEPRQWTRARKGKLFVFGSRRAANKFLSVFGSCVLPCEVKNPCKTKRLPPGSHLFSRGFAYFWNKIAQNGSLPFDIGYWPAGTLWADAVKILPDPKEAK